MYDGLFVIPLTLVALGAIALWYGITAKGSWKVKLFLIVLIPAMGLYAMREISSYQGYPTSETLPDKGQLLQMDILEPNAQTGDPGVINLWVRPLETKKKGGLTFLEYDPKRQPRAYRLPYSREMHERLERAKQMLKEGKPVMISKSGPKGEGEGDGEEGDGRPGGRRRGRNDGGSRVNDPQFDVYEMPPAHLPPKGP